MGEVQDGAITSPRRLSEIGLSLIFGSPVKRASKESGGRTGGSRLGLGEGGGFVFTHEVGLSFASLTATLAAHAVGRDETRADEQPARERAPASEGGRLFGQIGEDELGHIPSQVHISVHLTEGGGIDQIQVSIDQLRERGAPGMLEVVFEELRVGDHDPLSSSTRRRCFRTRKEAADGVREGPGQPEPRFSQVRL